MIIRRETRDGVSYGVRVWRDGEQKWVGTRYTLREARALERREQERTAAGLTHGLTVAAFATRWLEEYPRPRASTNRRYAYGIRPFVDRHGQLQLVDVDRGHARRYALEFPSTWPVARAMFADAEADGLIPRDRNPFMRLRLPRPRGRADVEPPTVAVVDELAAAAVRVHGPGFGARFAAAIVFSFHVGLRAGELFALRWDDLDLQAGTVTIRRSRAGAEETPTKSARARTVLVPPPAAAQLAQPGMRGPAAHVFTSKRGVALSKSNHHKLWAPVAAAAGRPGMDWHELRHGCATHLIDVLELDYAAVAQQLGHASIEEVVKRYGHPSERAARERVARAYTST